MNRIGDAALLSALSQIFGPQTRATFSEIALTFTKGSVHGLRQFYRSHDFIGAAAKSAQFPLYTWLSDAITRHPFRRSFTRPQ